MIGGGVFPAAGKLQLRYANQKMHIRYILMAVFYYKKVLFLLCKEIIVSYAFFYCNRFSVILIYQGRGTRLLAEGEIAGPATPREKSEEN